ncbi:MAG: hypothetical protein KA184_14710 [Candidatus Hydrogenedentes bacterium]|nr:hypothetical protein [Candidatus Hydrogenedentota bacterium]
MRLVLTAFMCAVVSLAYAEPANLAFTQAGDETYTFDTGVLRGTLRSEGRSLGLSPLEYVPTGARLDGNNYGLFSHYRVFTANKRYGAGAWEWPSTSALLPDGAVEVRWPAAEGRPFAMSAVYRWSAPDTLDLTTSVTAHEDLKAFESFVASYLTEAFPASVVYAKAGAADAPAFETTEKDKGDWQAFPRERAAVSIIKDGRWDIEPNPVDWAIRSDFAVPLGLRRNPESGLCAVVMAWPGDCFAVMTPHAGEGHRSVYLCLFGRDVASGETAVAHARLVVRVLNKDEDAVALYGSFNEKRQAQ